MEQELISILIPCYNTEKYLEKCLNSVVRQSYNNLEILILNDGSTDDSLKIMREFSAKDSRINIISRANKGVAITRNELIAKAKGNLVLFIDSDDYVAPHMVENLYKAMQMTQSDISMCNVKRVYLDTEEYNNSVFEHQEVTCRQYNRVETIFNLISVGDFYDFPVAKLIKKKCLQGVEFPLNRIYEDSATIFKIYNNIEKAVVLDNKYYSYLIGRENSITTKKYTSKNLNDNYLCISERYEFLSQNVPELLNEVKMGYIRNILTLLERAYLSNDDEIIHSNIVKNLLSEIKMVYFSIDNFRHRADILNNYKLSCLYLLLKDNLEDYQGVLELVNG